MMSRLLSPLAAAFFALFFALAVPAFAQAPPSAAPTGAPAETQMLTPPSGVIDATGGGNNAMVGSIPVVEMFLRADIVVKSVMILLVLASLWSWTIIFNKATALSGLKRKAKKFEKMFWSGQSLDELYRSLSSRPTHSMAALFVAAMREWKRSFEGSPRSFAGLQMRIEKVMEVTIAREVERLERRLLVLATVGSAGPFVGLFGTVWGIMSSFQSIAASKNTSLAVVAPGIAEALFATAIGLIAAIPATIFYNKFTSEVNRQAQRLEGFADEFSAILSRQIDERT